MTESTDINQPDPRDQIKYYFHATLFRRGFLALVKYLLWFVLDIRASGAENLPENGAVVLVMNHLTSYDVFPIQFSTPRPIFAIAKAELHKNFIIAAVLRQLGSFPVNRGKQDQWVIHHAEKVLEYGLVLGIFPEGTRSKGRGLRSAKTGAARFAIKANCPLVPMSIAGTEGVFKTFPRRAKVSVTFGEPIYPQPNEGPLALTDRVMFAIADMLPPELRGVYAEQPEGFG